MEQETQNDDVGPSSFCGSLFEILNFQFISNRVLTVPNNTATSHPSRALYGLGFHTGYAAPHYYGIVGRMLHPCTTLLLYKPHAFNLPDALQDSKARLHTIQYKRQGCRRI